MAKKKYLCKIVQNVEAPYAVGVSLINWLKFIIPKHYSFALGVGEESCKWAQSLLPVFLDNCVLHLLLSNDY